MTPAFLSIVVGLMLLVWSADRFVEGSVGVARHLGMSPLIIGMVIVGFGTSAPEMLVSAISSWQGNPGIALGNAYGSNIFNIGLIIGVTALINPITVHSQVLKKELPILTIVTGLAAFQLWDGKLSRLDAGLLLILFGGLMFWMIRQEYRPETDTLGVEVEQKLPVKKPPLGRSMLWLILGLVILIVSSRLLVWGAVAVAQYLGVNNLIIGLTIVAAGTSLPELASCVAATRKGEHDIVLGNILGSNLFNTLAVVGLAGVIHPMEVTPEVMNRDIPMMVGLTLSLFIIGFGFRRKGRVNRFEGILLIIAHSVYTAFLATTILEK